MEQRHRKLVRQKNKKFQSKGSLSPTQPSSSNTPYTNIWPLWPAFFTFLLTLAKSYSSSGLDLEGGSFSCQLKLVGALPCIPIAPLGVQIIAFITIMTTTIWIFICQMSCIFSTKLFFLNKNWLRADIIYFKACPLSQCILPVSFLITLLPFLVVGLYRAGSQRYLLNECG